MGFLDDAIREHLDLKRRHGADPAEIERAEREALGPVRRGPEVAEEDVPPQEHALDFAPEEPGEWQPPEERVELHDHEQLPPFESHEPEPAAEGRPEVEPGLQDEAFADPSPEPVPTEPPPAPADPSPPPPSHHVDRATEEYDVEAEIEEDDDVLESTPEFLQDAPDHDRLWFEQRPPRDFDFDG
jgi:hypothetical protein